MWDNGTDRQDWPGIFIRGDNCNSFVLALRSLRAYLAEEGGTSTWLDRQIEMFESSNVSICKPYD